MLIKFESLTVAGISGGPTLSVRNKILIYEILKYIHKQPVAQRNQMVSGSLAPIEEKIKSQSTPAGPKGILSCRMHGIFGLPSTLKSLSQRVLARGSWPEGLGQRVWAKGSGPEGLGQRVWA